MRKGRFPAGNIGFEIPVRAPSHLKSAIADGPKSGYNGGNPIVTGGSAVNPMRPYGVSAMCAAVWFAVLSMAAGLCAQEAAAPRHTGVPQDWSQGHIVFSRDALARHPELIYREPRILYQAMQRWRAPNSIVSYGADPLPASVQRLQPRQLPGGFQHLPELRECRYRV